MTWCLPSHPELSRVPCSVLLGQFACTDGDSFPTPIDEAESNTDPVSETFCCRIGCALPAQWLRRSRLGKHTAGHEGRSENATAWR